MKILRKLVGAIKFWRRWTDQKLKHRFKLYARLIRLILGGEGPDIENNNIYTSDVVYGFDEMYIEWCHVLGVGNWMKSTQDGSE